MQPELTVCPLNKHFAVAVDESENSVRALAYVAHLFGGLPDFRVTLLHIIFPPPDDFFETEDERLRWIASHQAAAEKMIDGYRQILLKGGFVPERIDTVVKVGDLPSVAECIFSEVRDLGAGTVVVGRRGRSKQEEFLLGSTSNKILHIAKQCAALWVVE